MLVVFRQQEEGPPTGVIFYEAASLLRPYLCPECPPYKRPRPRRRGQRGHARVPCSTAMPGESPPPGQPWERSDLEKRNAVSKRRVQALLTGASLASNDPAALEMDRYGLGPKGLEAWTHYSGLDSIAGTVRVPWPGGG